MVFKDINAILVASHLAPKEDQNSCKKSYFINMYLGIKLMQIWLLNMVRLRDGFTIKFTVMSYLKNRANGKK